MKSLSTALAALAMLGLATAALAPSALADEANGRVVSIDAGMLILEDGTAYRISDGVSVENLQPGLEVTVSYEEKDGQKVATDVQPAQ